MKYPDDLLQRIAAMESLSADEANQLTMDMLHFLRTHCMDNGRVQLDVHEPDEEEGSAVSRIQGGDTR